MGRTHIRYSMKWQYGVTGRTLANDPAPSGGQCASLPPRSPTLSRTMVSHAAVMVPVTLPFTGAKHEHYAHNDAFIPVMTRKNVYKLVFWKSLRGFLFLFFFFPRVQPGYINRTGNFTSRKCLGPTAHITRSFSELQLLLHSNKVRTIGKHPFRNKCLMCKWPLLRNSVRQWAI